jgi:hypothetical protein
MQAPDEYESDPIHGEIKLARGSHVSPNAVFQGVSGRIQWADHSKPRSYSALMQSAVSTADAFLKANDRGRDGSRFVNTPA